ncbi:sensor histidine kinase [Proteiniclasticum ruminis]|uniref:Two-component system, sensor histidine kinase YesM n=1 Tax=Proteiniclasticum ruminis TaxID=398199 RepID=A0A1I5BWK0_9CLOT|nr:histidine kinase [Proteiniclasticum ruminis]SFN79025.1 two-component system, sensor histidine kinase YesM [Proteiniclasticum ruminis]
MKKNERGYLADRMKLFMMVLLAFVLLMLTALLIQGFYLKNYAPFIAAVLFMMVLVRVAYLYIVLPMRETNKTLSLFSEGYILKGIYEIRVPYSKEQEDAVKKFGELLNTNELINSTKKHAEYLALQNQINPHFLYNTLEGIRSEALMEGIDSVAEMTEALATFFRYTISNLDRLVTIDEELENIENYTKIQKFRFGNRLELKVLFKGDKEEIQKLMMPKLTLQPLIENSIFHGVERKIGKGTIELRLTKTSERLHIVVSDDGLGMEPEKLQELNDRLKGTSLSYLKEEMNKRGGIALVNVNNRIRLIYGDEYGIFVYSKKNAGTDVHVTLPLVTEKHHG